MDKLCCLIPCPHIWPGAQFCLGGRGLSVLLMCFVSNRLTSCCCPALNLTASATWKRLNWMGKWVLAGPVGKLTFGRLTFVTLKAVHLDEKPWGLALPLPPAGCPATSVGDQPLFVFALLVPRRSNSKTTVVWLPSIPTYSIAYSIAISESPFSGKVDGLMTQCTPEPFVSWWSGFRHRWMTISICFG